jgi:cytochrome P450
VTELRPELSFDPADPAFIEDPYPTYAVLREAARVFHDRARERWFVTRFEDVRDCLRDRRLGRIFWHLFSAEQFGSKRPFWQDGQWPAFDEVERWDILFLEPPDHTRIRKLIASAFTPRSVERLREPAAKLSEELIDPLLEAGRFELMAEYAQPYSIALIAQLLGVPFAHHRELLDWSHRMVKMYEFDPTDQHKVAAERAAAEFRDFCIELIRQRRARPTEDLISALVHADVEGARRRRCRCPSC